MLATCEWCGTSFEAERSTARFCSEAHKKAAQRSRPSSYADEQVAEIERRPTSTGRRMQTLQRNLADAAAHPAWAAFVQLERERDERMESYRAEYLKARRTESRAAR